MQVLWDHLKVGRLENLPHYDVDAGKAATWVNNEFGEWVTVENPGTMRLAWSPLASPAHWAPVVKKLIEEDNQFSGAIVAFAWTGDLLQVAVGRTDLYGTGVFATPEWFSTGRSPRQLKGMRISGTEKRLVLHDRPMDVMWEIVEPESVAGSLVWPLTGVYGILPAKIGSFGPSLNIATGKVTSRDVETVEVKTPIVSIRNGMSVRPGPEGFRLETLVVMNPNGSLTPMPVWTGQRLDLSDEQPSEASG